MLRATLEATQLDLTLRNAPRKPKYKINYNDIYFIWFPSWHISDINEMTFIHWKNKWRC